MARSTVGARVNTEPSVSEHSKIDLNHQKFKFQTMHESQKLTVALNTQLSWKSQVVYTPLVQIRKDNLV